MLKLKSKDNNYHLVSIIIPTHNCANLLPRTINSVISQTYKDWELLVVDDGSTDNTKEVVKEYEQKDKRIKGIFLDKNSGGPAHPRNIGIQNSKGEYIAFLDSDDEWLPEKLEKQLDKFNQNNDLGFVGCNIFLIDNNKSRVVEIGHRGNILKDLLLGNFIWSGSNTIIKADYIRKNNCLFDEKLSYLADWDMWIQLSIFGCKFDYVSIPLLKYYFNREGSLTVKMGKIKIAKESEFILNKYYNIYSDLNILSSGIMRVGIELINAGDLARGREYLRRQFKEGPNNIKDIVRLSLFYILSFFGANFTNFITKLYQKIRNLN